MAGESICHPESPYISTAAKPCPSQTVTAMSDGDESSLSSVPTNITAYGSMLMNVGARLDSYQATSDDRTVAILKACVEFLPRDGKCNLCDDILDCETDQEVRQLARHLTSALLVPCKWIFPINLFMCLVSNSQ